MTLKNISPAACILLVLSASCYPVRPIQSVLKQPQVSVPVAAPSAVTPPSNNISDPFLIKLFKKYPARFDSILAQAEKRNIQVIYTRVDRGANNLPSFTDFTFQVDPQRYFYPASTVKFPAALLALQKINELAGSGITINSTMITEAGYSGQTAVYNDPNTPDGKPTVADYIKKIFLVSDNNAFNRLYEFLGQGYINDQLYRKGYASAQIRHRLDISLSEDENRHTNPVKFYSPAGSLLFSQQAAFNEALFPIRNDFQGSAYYRNDTLVNMPMDFSRKNRISLADLHQVLRSVLFPASVAARQRFNLTPGEYRFVYKYLSEFPAESMFPFTIVLLTRNHMSNFLRWAASPGKGADIRIFDKCGEAYGQLTDVAYVADFTNKVEFFISATINCTKNGVLNNDDYDYDSVGYPFFTNLAKTIYEYELSRKKKVLPDLSTFAINYDN